jgi:23S rRNA-intervening sequence protein
MAESYRDLKVWQRAIEMSIALYQLTEKFPKTEIDGLTT